MHLTTATVLVARTATVVGAAVQGSIGFGMNLVTVPIPAFSGPWILTSTSDGPTNRGIGAAPRRRSAAEVEAQQRQ